jgi:hypothetical protein
MDVGAEERHQLLFFHIKKTIVSCHAVLPPIHSSSVLEHVAALQHHSADSPSRTESALFSFTFHYRSIREYSEIHARAESFSATELRDDADRDHIVATAHAS